MKQCATKVLCGQNVSLRSFKCGYKVIWVFLLCRLMMVWLLSVMCDVVLKWVCFKAKTSLAPRLFGFTCVLQHQWLCTFDILYCICVFLLYSLFSSILRFSRRKGDTRRCLPALNPRCHINIIFNSEWRYRWQEASHVRHYNWYILRWHCKHMQPFSVFQLNSKWNHLWLMWVSKIQVQSKSSVLKLNSWVMKI